MRFVLEREGEGAASGEGAVIYRGFAHTKDADHPLEVTVELPSGATRAKLEGGAVEMEKVAAALVRAATKSAVTGGGSLPRKIVRWRG